MRIAFVSSAVPRRCGIATFTSDLAAGVRAADPSVRVQFAAIDEPFAAHAYAADVSWRIAQEDPAAYAAAARAVSRSAVDVVNLQHEFGLYGVWHDGRYDDHLRVFLDACTKPTVTTFHTVPPVPEPWMLTSIRDAADRSAAIVVMSATGARLLVLEQLADLGQREPRVVAQPADEAEPLQVLGVVQAVGALGAGGRGEQPDLLVVADRPRRETGLGGDLLDAQEARRRRCGIGGDRAAHAGQRTKPCR